MNRIREAPRPVENAMANADVDAAASILSRVIGPPLPRQTLDQITPQLTGPIPSGHDCTRCAAVSSCSLLNMAAENDGDNPIMKRMKAINLLKLENPDFMSGKSDKEREAIIREKISSFSRVTIMQETEATPVKPSKSGSEVSSVRKKRRKRRQSHDEEKASKLESEEWKKVTVEKAEAIIYMPKTEGVIIEPPAALKQVVTEAPTIYGEPVRLKKSKIPKPVSSFVAPVIRPEIHVNPFIRSKSRESGQSEAVEQSKKTSGEIFRFRRIAGEPSDKLNSESAPVKKNEKRTSAPGRKLSDIVHNIVNVFKFSEVRTTNGRIPNESSSIKAGKRSEKRATGSNSIFAIDKARFIRILDGKFGRREARRNMDKSRMHVAVPQILREEKARKFFSPDEIYAGKPKTIQEFRQKTDIPPIAIVLISLPSIEGRSNDRRSQESAGKTPGIPLDTESMLILLQNFSEASQILKELSDYREAVHDPIPAINGHPAEDAVEESPEEFYIAPTRKGKGFPLVVWYLVQVMNCLNITDIIFT